MDQEYIALRANARELFKSRAGKSVLWHILSMCDMNINAYRNEALETAHILGKQMVGQYILEFLEDVDPTIYPNLILDNIDHMEEDNAR